MFEITDKILLLHDDNHEQNKCLQFLRENSLEWDRKSTEWISTDDVYDKDEDYPIIILDFDKLNNILNNTIARLRERFPFAAIVILTHNHDEKVAQKLMAEGVQDYLVVEETSSQDFIQTVQFALERQKIKNELLQTKLNFKRIIEDVQDSILIIDQSRKIIYADSSVCKMFNKELDDLLGEDFNHPLKVGEKIKIKINGGERAPIYGEIKVDFTLWENKKAYLVSIKDITTAELNAEKAVQTKSLLTTLKDINALVAKNPGDTNIPQKVVDIISERREYLYAYLTLYNNDEKISEIVGSTNFPRMEEINEIYGHEWFPKCHQALIDLDSDTILEWKREDCSDCPLNKKGESDISLITSLELGKNKYGFINVSLRNSEYEIKAEEELIRLVKHNLSNALFVNNLSQEYKKGLISLERNKKRFEEFFEGNVAGSFISTVDGKLQDCNSQYLKIFGFKDKNEALASDLKNIYHDGKDRLKIIREVVNKKEVKEYSVILKKLNGELIYVNANIFGKFDSQNRLTHLIGFIQNVTERVAAERELIKLSQVVQQAPISIFITDIDGNIEYMNPFASELTGYTFSEVKGKNPRIFSSGKVKKEVYEELWATILQGYDWYGEFINKKKDGEIYYESAVISPIQDEDGNIINFVAVKLDITEQKQMFDELLYAKEEAEKADRMKSEFLAQVSHEIRTPLNPILSYVSMIKADLEDTLDDEMKTVFDSVNRSGKRIIRTVDLILNSSELQTGVYVPHKKDFNLYQNVLMVVYRDYKNIAEEKGLLIKLINNVEEANVKADESAMIQIFSNLVDNAVKYTEAGNIDLKLTRNDDDKLVVEISDTGIGISKDYLPILFEPFSQEEHGYTRRFDGIGLGLSIVKKYCDAHNINIETVSEKGKGTKISLTFN